MQWTETVTKELHGPVLGMAVIERRQFQQQLCEQLTLQNNLPRPFEASKQAVGTTWVLGEGCAVSVKLANDD